MAESRVLKFQPKEEEPTVKEAGAILNDVVLLALPSELFRQLNQEAVKRQMTLAQLLANALSAYLQS